MRLHPQRPTGRGLFAQASELMQVRNSFGWSCFTSVHPRLQRRLVATWSWGPSSLRNGARAKASTCSSP
eukprot:15347955-Alexandrium_andersonii.AAC.1